MWWSKPLRKGKLYAVHIDLTVPDRKIAVTRSGPKDHAHEDVYVALRDAFNAATRMLEDHSRRTGGRVKSHELPLHGKIVRLYTPKELLASSRPPMANSISTGIA